MPARKHHQKAHKASALDSNPKMSHKLSSVDEQFITDIDTLLFSQVDHDYFPLIINIPESTPEITKLLQNVDIHQSSPTCLRINKKDTSDKIIPKLYKLCPTLKLDYSNFISHPGNLFIKNLSKSKLDHGKMFKFFQSNSVYHSLQELNVFNQNADSDDDIFAILRFENYLDAEHLIAKSFNKNPFNTNSASHLYLNKYISKKQRKLNDETDEFNKYNTLIVENLLNFFPSDFDFTTKSLESFFKKFEIFNGIKSIYFPLDMADDDKSFSLHNFGFLSFEGGDNTNMKILESIYFLNNSTYEEFTKFTENDIANLANSLKDDTEVPEERQNAIRISISQHKHNHLLYQFYPSYLSFDHGNLSVSYLNLSYHASLINNFLKFFNYQETNVYVNNFSSVFNNNDALWEAFWGKFGQIKSAKIIKPQFYSKENQSVGKIGFVFFKDFKMALRAIILTNNKLINLNNSNIVIKTSFAIQKMNKEKKNSISAVPNVQPSSPSSTRKFSKDAIEFYPSPRSYYPYYYDMAPRGSSVHTNESDDTHEEEPNYSYVPVPMPAVAMPAPMSIPFVALQPQAFNPYYQYYNPYYQVQH